MFTFPKELTCFFFMGKYRNQAVNCFALTTIGIFKLTFSKNIRFCGLQISILILPPQPQILIPYESHDFPESTIHLQPWKQKTSYE